MQSKFIDKSQEINFGIYKPVSVLEDYGLKNLMEINLDISEMESSEGKMMEWFLKALNIFITLRVLRNQNHFYVEAFKMLEQPLYHLKPRQGPGESSR